MSGAVDSGPAAPRRQSTRAGNFLAPVARCTPIDAHLSCVRGAVVARRRVTARRCVPAPVDPKRAAVAPGASGPSSSKMVRGELGAGAGRVPLLVFAVPGAGRCFCWSRRARAPCDLRCDGEVREVAGGPRRARPASSRRSARAPFPAAAFASAGTRRARSLTYDATATCRRFVFGPGSVAQPRAPTKALWFRALRSGRDGSGRDTRGRARPSGPRVARRNLRLAKT